MPREVDVIGGFQYADPSCKGCGKPLAIENAWMTDGCPCNAPNGINSMNETRWRLLMQLQQRQSRAPELPRITPPAMPIGSVEMQEYLMTTTAVKAAMRKPLGAAFETELVRQMRETMRLHRFIVMNWLLQNGNPIELQLIADQSHPLVGSQMPDKPMP